MGELQCVSTKRIHIQNFKTDVQGILVSKLEKATKGVAPISKISKSLVNFHPSHYLETVIRELRLQSNLEVNFKVGQASLK